MSRLSVAVSALALFGALTSNPAEAVQRAFVASYGSDANTATNCGFANPCRGFTAAMTVMDPGGEVIALDAAGYGAVTITKSITLTANPGFYAGIASSSGAAVTIATAGVNVTLRGLNINGVGASDGVVMTNGARLSIENCIISNFTNNGVDVQTAAVVRIVDSIIRENGNDGVFLDKGATATITGSKVLGNSYHGVWINVATTATVTSAAISDVVASGNSIGVQATAGFTGATALMSVTRSTLSNNQYGAAVYAGAGTAVVTLSDSMATKNLFNGIWQGIGGTGTATFESLGNNTVRQNTGSNASGTITTVAPM